MDIELPPEVGAEHRRRLAWFEEYRGQVVGWPALSRDDMRLVQRAKGIYKPAGWDYVLSVRTYLNETYPDGDVEPLPGGGWALRYHQEGQIPADRDAAWSNIALMACWRDHIPVGVLRQVVPKGKNGPKFEVLGLAAVAGWEDGYFSLVGSPASSVSVLEAIARSELDAIRDADVPDSDYDARLRAHREIVARQGQSDFRNSLITAYQGQCAVTSCNVLPVLEAAHLRPYRGPDSNTIPNGLLLRADIHTLLDYRLLAVEPGSMTIVLSSKLSGTQYVAISGAPLAAPVANWQRPDKRVLDVIWNEFRKAEQALEVEVAISHAHPAEGSPNS